MMSGGDLDGDVYFVTWDQELLSYITPASMHEPADYSQSELIKEKPECTNPDDELADYFVFYLQRDVLGTLSNLWLVLCDHYGQHGPRHEDCIALAHMCSVAVDFAKHGECVSEENYAAMRKLCTQANPDFLERDSMKKRTFESEGVLGQLYRDVSCSEPLHQFVENEWKNAVRADYKLDSKILTMVGHDLQNLADMHSYLVPCFELIVKPMSERLKKIMAEFQLACEGQLFACDLKFRLCFLSNQDDKQAYLGDPGNKNEDAIKNLNCLRRAVTEEYSAILEGIIEQGTEKGDAGASLNASVALYLATYFASNESGTEYMLKHQHESHFSRFLERWCQTGTKLDDKFEKKMRNNLDIYHQTCVEAELGNQKKLRKLLHQKKLFSIPWLLAGDILLCHYPDKYDNASYMAKLRHASLRKQKSGEQARRRQAQ